MKLRCENLVKKYGPRTVVKGVSMEVEQGEIVGFLRAEAGGPQRINTQEEHDAAKAD